MFSSAPEAEQDPYGDTYAMLEDEIEFDPEQTKLLLAALKQQHTSHIASFQKTVANTRSVYSKKLKRKVFATSWQQLKLDIKEGPLPPTPPRTPTPSTVLEESDSSSCGTIYSSDSASDGNGSDESSSPETDGSNP